MKLNAKTKEFLNQKCIQKFGATFDQVYELLEKQEQLKKENKELEKQKRNALKHANNHFG